MLYSGRGVFVVIFCISYLIFELYQYVFYQVFFSSCANLPFRKGLFKHCIIDIYVSQCHHDVPHLFYFSVLQLISGFGINSWLCSGSNWPWYGAEQYLTLSLTEVVFSTLSCSIVGSNWSNSSRVIIAQFS